MGPPIVLAHGFTQTARCWGPLADRLAIGNELHLVDLPGHGNSTDVTVSFPDAARMLGETGGHAVYVGYSMGARIALRLAVDHPELVRHLVLVSGTAGIEDANERNVRREADETLAGRLAAIERDDRVSLGQFLDEWLRQPLFAGLPTTAWQLDERQRNSGGGLARSLRLHGTGVMEPLWEHLGNLSVPTTIITGADDAKFTDLGRRLAGRIGTMAAHHVIPNAGHAVHLQRPDAVADLILGAIRAG